MANQKIYCHQKQLILTDNEEQYFMPPAEHIKSYIYCKYKSDEDLLCIIKVCQTDAKLQLALVYHPDLNFLFSQFKNLHTNVSAAGGIVENEKNEVLLIYRKNKWDLPKGKADKGETIEQTALREVEEETGIQNLVLLSLQDTTYHTYLEDKQQMFKTTSWFKMSCDSASQTLIPQAIENITEVKWVPKAEIKSYITATYASITQLLENIE